MQDLLCLPLLLLFSILFLAHCFTCHCLHKEGLTRSSNSSRNHLISLSSSSASLKHSTVFHAFEPCKFWRGKIINLQEFNMCYHELVIFGSVQPVEKQCFERIQHTSHCALTETSFLLLMDFYNQLLCKTVPKQFSQQERKQNDGKYKNKQTNQGSGDLEFCFCSYQFSAL